MSGPLTPDVGAKRKMKHLLLIAAIPALLATSSFADIAIIGKEEMIAKTDLIAIVNIQQLTSTDRSRIQVDLMADGMISRTLKGDKRGSITFRIPRSFPCAELDVSTGQHLVFLTEINGELQGINSYMSYIYLGREKAKWYDVDGKISESITPVDLIKEVEELIKQPQQPLSPR